LEGESPPDLPEPMGAEIDEEPEDSEENRRFNEFQNKGTNRFFRDASEHAGDNEVNDRESQDEEVEESHRDFSDFAEGHDRSHGIDNNGIDVDGEIQDPPCTQVPRDFRPDSEESGESEDERLESSDTEEPPELISEQPSPEAAPAGEFSCGEAEEEDITLEDDMSEGVADHIIEQRHDQVASSQESSLKVTFIVNPEDPSGVPRNGQSRCTFCWMYFEPRTRDLREHEKAYHPQSCFTCATCPKQFTCSEDLRRHSNNAVHKISEQFRISTDVIRKTDEGERWSQRRDPVGAPNSQEERDRLFEDIGLAAEDARNGARRINTNHRGEAQWVSRVYPAEILGLQQRVNAHLGISTEGDGEFSAAGAEPRDGTFYPTATSCESDEIRGVPEPDEECHHPAQWEAFEGSPDKADPIWQIPGWGGQQCPIITTGNGLGKMENCLRKEAERQAAMKLANRGVLRELRERLRLKVLAGDMEHRMTFLLTMNA
jgi:hypothetical protein